MKAAVLTGTGISMELLLPACRRQVSLTCAAVQDGSGKQKNGNDEQCMMNKIPVTSNRKLVTGNRK